MQTLLTHAKSTLRTRKHTSLPFAQVIRMEWSKGTKTDIEPDQIKAPEITKTAVT